MASYVYRYNRETSLYEVGFYHHDQTWEPDTGGKGGSTYTKPESASSRVAWLNGGFSFADDLRYRVEVLESNVKDFEIIVNGVSRELASQAKSIAKLYELIHSLDRRLTNTGTELIGGHNESFIKESSIEPLTEEQKQRMRELIDKSGIETIGGS